MVNLEEKLKEIESAYEQNQQHIEELLNQQKRLEGAYALLSELIEEKEAEGQSDKNIEREHE